MMIASLVSHGTSVTNLVGQGELLILLLVVTLIVALLSRLMRIPYTLLLVIIGFLIGIVGLLSFLPHEHLDPNLVLYIFIPALLFEGAWNADLDRLEAEWLPIIQLAIPGMVLSLLVVAVVLHVGINLSWLLALLVGAIVAPTDPIAVIALFQQLGVPDRLRILVEGESIFNDGTGGAAYELVLAVLLPTLGLAEVSGKPSFQNAPALGIMAEVLWLIFGGFPDLAFRPSLGAFTAQHADLLAALSLLPIDAWERSARVSTVGRVLEPTVLSYAERPLVHERPHLKQIAGIAGTMHARKGSEDGS